MDISSTFIRQAIADGKDVPFFLHDQVYRYVKEKGFFGGNGVG